MKKIIMNNNIYLLISKEDKICIIKKGNQNGFRYRVWIPIIQNQKFDQINRPLRISKVIPFMQIPVKGDICSAPTVRSVHFKRCGASSL